jgi:hypothetical protein
MKMIMFAINATFITIFVSDVMIHFFAINAKMELTHSLINKGNAYASMVTSKPKIEHVSPAEIQSMVVSIALMRMYATPVIMPAIGNLTMRQISVPAKHIISIKANCVINALMDVTYVQIIKPVLNVMQLVIGFLINIASVDVKITISRQLIFYVRSA